MKFNDKIPIYYQIKQYIYREIIINNLQPGQKVPAVRQLAVTLTVNANTIQRALSELINEKVLISKRGKGNFVTTDAETLTNLKRNVVEDQVSNLYDQLAALKITPDEMLKYLNNYINSRKEVHHD
ncbi:GntR family transcriptional regulator [Pediococcus ethanolidurans]|uniref:GntR family transcriptional regulator n=1 Tax=Pediococcus ethanolidurans TaxID=319653 RepID=UPI001C1EF20D|nr:GntR family transcriptional regulator [Pediococcus ethanolidurans]MBU7555637.1 GntR family transcriptional regulator [Pediococcus ethanolidurans]MBU7564383.1 GntR family transcriptional regulator [Pediococcus ethanolidurans]MCT4398213.1 GntR family transcriptional regulator [Pediococcus ethanolidurans]MCV3316142.1 GntR family transcriptional regulator [Pediococcus ethanolidurans]MCV3322401.1 GntR family transcriptional regulator [Pediococcus ethanolidurans]